MSSVEKRDVRKITMLSFSTAVLFAACSSGGSGSIISPTPVPVILSSGQFALPAALAGPTGLTSGPDGAMWFTAFDASAIGRITTAGAIQGFPLPSKLDEPSSISTGPDGALWFTEYFSGRIGRITTSGAITEYPLPSPSSQPESIVSAPDGALWFTEQNSQSIGRITTAGTIAEYPLATGSNPGPMTIGPDNVPWFAEVGTGQNRPDIIIRRNHRIQDSHHKRGTAWHCLGR